MKADRDRLLGEVEVARDSIASYKKVTLKQDSTIKVRDSIITEYQVIGKKYRGMVSYKDSVILERNNKISELEETVTKRTLLSMLLAATTILFIII